MSYRSDWEHSDKTDWDYVQYRNAAYREDAEDRYFRNHYNEDDDDDYENKDD